MTDAALAFAAHVAATRFHHLPPPAVERAKVFLLDTLGVAMAGSTAQGAAEVLAAARGWGEGAGATVLVASSFILRATDMKTAVQQLKQAATK